MNAFVFNWRSPAMRAPAFWYYAQESNARTQQQQMAAQPGYTVSAVEQREVPDDTPLLDRVTGVRIY